MELEGIHGPLQGTSLVCYKHYPKIKINKHNTNIQEEMNIWMKIAAGLLGGIAIVASLGGFKGKDKTTTTTNYEPEPEISDDIFDGIREPEPPQRKNSNSIRARNEQNIRNLQEGLTKASNVLGHISIICNSVVKMFYEDPCIKVTPTTIIV